MENARILDERLKKIIREISGKTGANIKQELLQELESRVNAIIKEQSRNQLTGVLISLKKVLNDI
ncbi:hypothetical protein [Desulfolucanica intricata]|uniref:hypothetical protein n=1 Tax=Desulfolucanica intricata TaxID=1285191 RepID=UPI00083242F4|nr:hypothetical protein [Desulfolucanica intricata]